MFKPAPGKLLSSSYMFSKCRTKMAVGPVHGLSHDLLLVIILHVFFHCSSNYLDA